jgi:hypothetical protein
VGPGTRTLVPGPFVVRPDQARRARPVYYEVTLTTRARSHKGAQRGHQGPTWVLRGCLVSWCLGGCRIPTFRRESLLRAQLEYGIISLVKAHSSSGLGRGPLKAEIRGSNPLCATMRIPEAPPGYGGAFFMLKEAALATCGILFRRLGDPAIRGQESSTES